MPPQTATPIKASTQEHLDLYDVQDGIVIMKDGSCALIMQITAINFGLLSEGEQDAIIFAYAGLLNSLTYQVQIIVQSNIKDITDYIRLVKSQEGKQKNQLLKNQLIKYREFVESTVRDNRVLDKKFYVSIPFTTYELGLSTSVTSSSFLLGSKKKTHKLPFPITHIMERAKFNLFPKRDHIVRQFARIGLKTRQLNTQQLLELFYTLYNRESVGQRFVDSKDYEKPFVNPALGRTNVTTQPEPFKGAEGHTSPAQAPQTPPNQNQQAQTAPQSPPASGNIPTVQPQPTPPTQPNIPAQPQPNIPAQPQANIPAQQQASSNQVFPQPQTIQAQPTGQQQATADQAFGYANK